MRLSKEESDRLDSLMVHYGLNGASVIRMLLKREADTVRDRTSLQLASKPAYKKAKRRTR